MKKPTEKIECPICNSVQEEDLYDFVDSGDQEGTFEIQCEVCENGITIEFEFVPYLKVSKS